MVLPTSPNAISLNNVNTEFGRASQTPIAMNDIYLRTLFSDWINPISMSSGWGKSWPLIHSGTYAFTAPGASSFTVPAGAYYVSVKAWGAGGGAGGRGSGGTSQSGGGGSGSFLWGIFDVVPGETIVKNVGGYGIGGVASGLAPFAGEGGGGGGPTYFYYASRSGTPYGCIVAGGGGGGGSGGGTSDRGGPGGGGGAWGGSGTDGINGQNNGATGSSAPGLGGTTTAGGAGGAGNNDAGQAGGFLTGGEGGTNNAAPNNGGIGGGGDGGNNGLDGGGGGGGGGGWWGGGGGGWTGNQGGGGGGGGSTYFAGTALLYNYGGSTGAIGRTTYQYPAYGDANWNNYGIGAPGRGNAGTGENGFNGAILFEFFTT